MFVCLKCNELRPIQSLEEQSSKSARERVVATLPRKAGKIGASGVKECKRKPSAGQGNRAGLGNGLGNRAGLGNGLGNRAGPGNGLGPAGLSSPPGPESHGHTHSMAVGVALERLEQVV